MAHANPIPSQRIINNYLPAIADRLQQIRQHTEGRVLLTQINLEARYEDINRYLEQIRQEATPLLNITLDHRNLHHNYTIITAERDQYQNLLNEENRQVNDLRRQLNEARAQVLRTDRMMTDALRDERNARREYWEIAENRKQRISELLRNNFAFQLLNQQKNQQITDYRKNIHRWTVRYNNDTERWRSRHAGCIRQAQNWKGQFRASQTLNNNLQQQINNLQQQILILQNNALLNMATIQDVMHTIAPSLANLPNYDGQEPPDSYYQKLRNINELARPLAVAAFNAATRANIMKNKMSGRFLPVPANNPYNGNAAINTEAEFLNWLQGKYRDEMWLEAGRSTQQVIYQQPLTSINAPPQYIQPTPQNNEAFRYLELIAEYFGYPDECSRKPEDLFKFIEAEFGKRVAEVFHTRKRAFTPKKRTYKAITKSSSKKNAKSVRHCSNCGKSGHTKKTCTGRKKSSKSVNFVEVSENESNSESSDNETHHPKIQKKRKSGKVQEKPSTQDVVQDIFRASFKSLIGSLVSQCPNEILLEILLFINREYAGLKDQLLSHYTTNYSTKEKEKIWDRVSALYMDLLHPLVETVNHFQRNSKEQVNEKQEAEMKSNSAKKINTILKQQFPITPDKTLDKAIKMYQQ
ncbi:unnamed protein product [Rhizophagus irregularis]|nr:unnamed protein product [Rhizophagus irregularis]